MELNIEELVTQYDVGKITRRALICALATAAVPSRSLESSASFQGISFNHVTMRVSNARRSADFYRQLLGLPILKQKASSVLLRVGTSFLALDSTTAQNEKGIDHFSFGVNGFRLDQASALLRHSGLHPEVVKDVELYFRDPDGIRVQLSAPDYAGHP